jgi:hypothetical protein
VEKSELPRKLRLGRCIDHVCVLTIREFTKDMIVVDSHEAIAKNEEGKMVSVMVHWKLVEVVP